VDKVQTVENASRLLELVRQDGGGATRFPIRFILVKGLTAWRAVIQALTVESNEVIMLSSLCRDQDTFPDLESLIPLLKVKEGKKVLILPMGECIRFSLFRDARVILRELAGLDQVGQERFYFPLFEVEDIFDHEMERVSRYKAGTLPQVWSVVSRGTIKVKVAPIDLKKMGYKAISGIKNYLQAWEDGGHDKIQLVTRYAPHMEKRFGSFEIQVYQHVYEIVLETSNTDPDKRGSFRQEHGRDDQWRWLAREVKEAEYFGDLAARLLNVRVYDQSQLSSLWESFDDNRKWLFWLWSKTEVHPGTYLHLALEDSSFEEYEEALINSVFKQNLGIEMLRERKDLIKGLRIGELPQSFWRFWNEQQGPLAKLSTLTGLTAREREQAVLAVKELLEVGSGVDKWWHFLEIAYPELAYYLTTFHLQDDFITGYFRHYTHSKVMDQPKAELLRLARQAAEAKTILQFPTRHSLLEKCDKANTVVWVDGLGLEWVGLINGLLRDRKDLEFDLDIARCNLPTITELNKGWENEADVERELDNIAHRPNYRFPVSFVEEIEAVTQVIDKVIGLLDRYREVVITSDHGLTRFPVSEGKIPPPSGSVVFKWGRYVEFSNSQAEESSNPYWVVDGNRIMQAVHQKFEGGGGCAGEAHGGATLEEALVPVIRLREAAGATLASRVKLQVKDTPVRLNARGEGQLIIEVSKPLNGMRLGVADQVFEGVQEGIGRWVFVLKGFKTGEYRGQVELQDNSVKQVEFKTLKGLAEDKLGL
jgi:hypothetical protein